MELELERPIVYYMEIESNLIKTELEVKIDAILRGEVFVRKNYIKLNDNYRLQKTGKLANSHIFK